MMRNARPSLGARRHRDRGAQVTTLPQGPRDSKVSPPGGATRHRRAGTNASTRNEVARRALAATRGILSFAVRVILGANVWT